MSPPSPPSIPQGVPHNSPLARPEASPPIDPEKNSDPPDRFVPPSHSVVPSGGTGPVTGRSARTPSATYRLISKSGQLIDKTTLLEIAKKADFIVIGEQHDDPLSHHVQLETIRQLIEAGLDIGIGLEMVPLDLQPVFDKFNANKNSLIFSLEKDLDWDKTWGYPFHFFAPIFELAKKHQRPLIALNINSDIVKRFSRKGADALTKDEQKQLPPKIIPPVKEQVEYLKEIAKGHHGMGPNQNSIIKGQSLRDSIMAHRALQYRRGQKGPIVILAGVGHAENGWGIPHALFEIDPSKKVLVLTPSSGQTNDHCSQKASKSPTPFSGEEIFFTDQSPTPKPLKFGQKKGKLEITSINTSSLAYRSGLREGDIIHSVGKCEVKKISDLYTPWFRALAQGTTLPIVIERKGGKKTLNIDLSPKKNPKIKIDPAEVARKSVLIDKTFEGIILAISQSQPDKPETRKVQEATRDILKTMVKIRPDLFEESKLKKMASFFSKKAHHWINGTPSLNMLREDGYLGDSPEETLFFKDENLLALIAEIPACSKFGNEVLAHVSLWERVYTEWYEGLIELGLEKNDEEMKKEDNKTKAVSYETPKETSKISNELVLGASLFYLTIINDPEDGSRLGENFAMGPGLTFRTLYRCNPNVSLFVGGNFHYAKSVESQSEEKYTANHLFQGTLSGGLRFKSDPFYAQFQMDAGLMYADVDRDYSAGASTLNFLGGLRAAGGVKIDPRFLLELGVGFLGSSVYRPGEIDKMWNISLNTGVGF